MYWQIIKITCTEKLIRYEEKEELGWTYLFIVSVGTGKKIEKFDKNPGSGYMTNDKTVVPKIFLMDTRNESSQIELNQDKISGTFYISWSYILACRAKIYD